MDASETQGYDPDAPTTVDAATQTNVGTTPSEKVTLPVLQRLRGDFTIAECLESLGRRQNRTWGADALARLRESLSVLIGLGMLQTELADPIAFATTDLRRRAPVAVVLDGGVLGI